ncbi:tRNA uridine(34) 5-carboxymethylaminomethyl modification radical SAM/GNAT enzyme Elp3 [bacterium]|nr:tRNA uridine(34) 5-carboxymethylaminomethyl modification radical SAM/GNAT enzyme Elp3 [bacterium]
MTPQEEIIIAFSKTSQKTRSVLDSLKREISKKYSLPLLKNSQLIKAYHKLVEEKRITPNKKILDVLKIRKIRSLSGIVIVSVLTKPYKCPGRCLFCPAQKNVPKSYIKEEPAVARAILYKYHPYKQVQARLQALESTGHNTDKIDLRIIGGTWSYYPSQYQTWFIKECFRAANDKNSKFKIQNSKLEEEQKRNERARRRIIGITIETRPDFVNDREIKRLRKLGITRVELGVQSIYDDVLKINRRGHGVEATIRATKLLKDAGFKICYQMMPNLLGSNWQRDLQMFKELFENPQFQPDYLKIYPCALLKEADLYKFWKRGLYKPYSKKELIELIIKIKQIVPYYCRIQRIIRDIPSNYVIEGGVKISNLRQIVHQIMQERGLRCKCIRCREVKERYNPKEKIYLFRQDYWASDGLEIFLSFENKNRSKLFSLLRLRIPSFYFQKGEPLFSVLKGASIVRELHTYGLLLPISKKDISPQHRGLGKKLMKKAEEISKKEFGVKKIAVISGVGVREYYRKLGYRLYDTYMIKKL